MHGGEVICFGCFCFRGELGFLNCDNICICIVNKQFELLKFVFDSVYVDLQYDEIFLTFTAGSVCSHVVVFGLFLKDDLFTSTRKLIQVVEEKDIRTQGRQRKKEKST